MFSHLKRWLVPPSHAMLARASSMSRKLNSSLSSVCSSNRIFIPALQAKTGSSHLWLGPRQAKATSRVKLSSISLQSITKKPRKRRITKKLNKIDSSKKACSQHANRNWLTTNTSWLHSANSQLARVALKSPKAEYLAQLFQSWSKTDLALLHLKDTLPWILALSELI